MKRPAVLMLISHFPPTVGGTERQARCLAAGLVGLGHRVTVLTSGRAGLPVREVIDGIVVERRLVGYGRGVVFLLTYLGSVLHHLGRLRRYHSILHAHHLYLEALAAAWLRARRDFPAIAKVAGGGMHGDFDRLRRTRLSLALPLLRQLSRIIAVSREIEAELLAHGFKPDRIQHIPNGVDVGRFAPASDAGVMRARAELGPESVLYLGRLDNGKGLEVALDAWAQVAPRRPAARLVFIGDGPARPSLEAMAGTLGLADRVQFRGFRDDPERLLQAAQAFLLPSWSEGLSNALLEAMATGLACVATKVGGALDAVEHGVSGLLVRPGDSKGMAEALLAILEAPELRSRLGRAARTTTLDRFAMERVVRGYHDLYMTLTEDGV